MLFDEKGQLNASSIKDAVQNIVQYSAIDFSELKPPFVLDGDNLLEYWGAEPHEKIAMAQSMANPIRKNLDYRGIARKLLVVDPLPQGTIPSYDRDIDVAAVVISSNGTGPESRVFGDRVVVPEFEIYSNPTVRISEVKRRRFNVIDRIVQKARQEVVAQEDGNIFLAIDAACPIENTVVDINAGGVLKSDLVKIKQQCERWDLVTAHFFMHINEFTDILKWGSGSGQGVNGGDFEPVTMREVLLTGLYANIWGIDIMVSKMVPLGSVYGCADPEFIGVMPTIQDIEVLPADDPKQMKLGWAISEIVGIAILNPRGCCKGEKSIVIGA